jgi:SagB-type dehydrogenase family enzyme
MFLTDSTDPKPRETPLNSPRYVYHKLDKRYLPIPKSSRRDKFFTILESRRTRRHFRKISEANLGELLWYSGKTFNSRLLPNGRIVQYRCCPSAGAVHPIDILLLDTSKDSILIYDPVGHAVETLDGSREQVKELKKLAESIVEIEDGQIFWFAAEFNRTLDVYQNGESLVWRDVGALVATICYVCEALSLNCCPIGATGEPHVSTFLNSGTSIVGVGGCVVGVR